MSTCHFLLFPRVRKQYLHQIFNQRKLHVLFFFLLCFLEEKHHWHLTRAKIGLDAIYKKYWHLTRTKNALDGICKQSRYTTRTKSTIILILENTKTLIHLGFRKQKKGKLLSTLILKTTAYKLSQSIDFDIK